MLKKLKNISIVQSVLLLFLLVSAFSFSKDFWEKKSFTVDVVETLKINGSSKTKGYIMSYSGGILKFQITEKYIHLNQVQKQYIILP